jgi:PAS domain-containing protein
MPAPVDFGAPDLAAHIERLNQFNLDQLPFGVILIDRDGIVLFYSQTEAKQSGYGKAHLPLKSRDQSLTTIVPRPKSRHQSLTRRYHDAA